MGKPGLVLPRNSTGNSGGASFTDADSDASGGAVPTKAPSPPLQDPDLATVAAVWADLPSAVRTGIMAMVNTIVKGGKA